MGQPDCLAQAEKGISSHKAQVGIDPRFSLGKEVIEYVSLTKRS
jgi:hypothetical protein